MLNVHFVQFGGQELRQEDQSAESVKNQMTVQEWEKVFEMSQDKNLYHNLCTSLFPTIHGVLNIVSVFVSNPICLVRMKIFIIVLFVIDKNYL